MINNFFLAKKPHNGMSYETYFERFKQHVQSPGFSNENGSSESNPDLIKLNFQRSQRIGKTYSVDSELRTIVEQIKYPQLWLVLTEEWCGDSAQIIPYLAKIAECNPLINFRLLLRDENLDIMDLYLTNGNRGIPKLVAFDLDGNELFQWGPRPLEAANLVQKLKDEGKTKGEFIEQLHLWYARNRGKAVEDEIKNILVKHFSIVAGK